MPRVNKVGAKKQATPVAAATPEVTPAVADLLPTKEETAIAQSGGLNLPAFLQQDSPELPQIALSDMSGFSGFAHSMSKNWPAQQAAGLEEGNPFIMDGGQYIKCDPLEYIMLTGASFRTEMQGQDMKLVYCTEDVDDTSNSDAQPHYVTLMLVYAEGRLIPIIGDFRGTKAGAAEKAFAAIAAAATADWPKLSDAHKVSCEFGKPWGRVWNSVTCSAHIGKSSGNKYHRANCVSKPTNASQIRILIDHLADASFVGKLNKAFENYSSRVNTLKQAAAKQK